MFIDTVLYTNEIFLKFYVPFVSIEMEYSRINNGFLNN